MREMKDSGVVWIGEIPEKWETVRFKDHYKNKKEIAGEHSSEFERLALTLNGVIKRPKDDSEGLQPKEFDTYQILRENDFVFKMIDLQNISTSRVGLSPYTGLVSPAYIRFTSRKENQFNKFTYYFLMSMYYNCVFNNLGGDGVRSALNASDMGTLMIPNPNLATQQKIASLLDRKCTQIDALIANAEQQIEKLKAYKQSVITETVTKGLDPDVQMKDSGVEWIGEIPEHCSLVPMKYLAEAIGDGIHSTPNYDINGDIFFINGNNIGEEQLHFKESTNRLNANEYANYKAPLLTDNTILITLNGATYGKTSFYNNEPVLLGKSAGYITLKPYVNKRYIRYYLQSSISKLIMDLSLAGTTIQNVSLRTLNTFTVVYPEIKEQERIVAYLDHKCSQIDKLTALKQQKIEKLQQYKKSIIYEYVTGKKEV